MELTTYSPVALQSFEERPFALKSVMPGFVPPLGALGDLLRLMEPDSADSAALGSLTPITWRRLHTDETLIHEGLRGHSLFILRCGSLKCVKTLEDGYEQVMSFVQPGEVTGFEAMHGGEQPSSVLALEDSSVYILPVRDLLHLQERCPTLAIALQRGLSRQLANAAATAEMMAAVASEVRLARFILWWSGRMARAGRSPRRLRLCMGRRDIASLIGVAHATVSRSFTLLADEGCLRVDNRDVDILDFDALKARARSTRGQTVGANAPRNAMPSHADLHRSFNDLLRSGPVPL